MCLNLRYFVCSDCIVNLSKQRNVVNISKHSQIEQKSNVKCDMFSLSINEIIFNAFSIFQVIVTIVDSVRMYM